MRVWSIQPEKLYEDLKIKKALHCDPTQSELITECGFGPAYDWLVRQMKERVGLPPKGVLYPFWAWHTLEWKHQRPDLRRMEFRAIKAIRYAWSWKSQTTWFSSVMRIRGISF